MTSSMELRMKRDVREQRANERAIRIQVKRNLAEVAKLKRAACANPFDYVQVAADGSFTVDAARVRKDRDLIEKFTIETVPGRNGRPPVTRIDVRMADKLRPLTTLWRKLDRPHDAVSTKLRMRART